MGTRERHIGHAAARTAPVADPRGGRLFAMPRFLVGITHQVYRHRVFAIAGAITASSCTEQGLKVFLVEKAEAPRNIGLDLSLIHISEPTRP